MDIILQHFPNLSDIQIQQFQQLSELYKEWNSKINVISRKDIDNLYINHVLHSLSIAKVIDFLPYTYILDVGTGGGFPAIPLAILFPQSRFHAIDATAKKIKVANIVIEAIGLTNIVAEQIRIEQLDVNGKMYDFMVTRGVAKLPILYNWAKKVVAKNDGAYNEFQNGLIALKGGDLTAEIDAVKRKVGKFPISDYFDNPHFKEKFVLYVRV